ncbi:MAG TPA: hypothetical protein VF391_09270 [Dermatophilaceae bacterium]
MPTPAASPAGRAGAVADRRIERSIQLWMHAYPRRWRASRGEELVDLVVDLAGPDARRLGGHPAFDLLRGGWATRWREHPPLHTWLLYRILDRRIPVRYRSWALDDIDGLWYPLRHDMSNVVLIPLLLLFLRPWTFGTGGLLFWLFNVLVLAPMLIRPGRRRRDARLKHVMPLAGEPLVEGTLLAWDVPVARASARSALAWVVLLLGFTLALSAVPPIVGHRSVPVPVLLVGLGFGALGAAVVRQRMRRLLGQCPDQPHRILGPVCAAEKGQVLLWAMLLSVLTWQDASSQYPLGFSLLPGAVALLLLPGALVALAVTRGTDAADPAGRDVWSIAVRGRVPAVDRPVPELRPQPGPVVEGSLVQLRRPEDPRP